MARKLLLSDDEARILVTRVELFHELGVFFVRDLITNWGISIRSMYRYTSPEHRQRSRDDAQKAYVEYKKKLVKGICYFCEGKLKGHARCPGCTILLHDGKETCGSEYCIGYAHKDTM